MSVSQFSSLQCAPIPMIVIDMCCLVNKVPSLAIPSAVLASCQALPHPTHASPQAPLFWIPHVSNSTPPPHGGLWHSYQIYLQVHWPEGQAHEVPQLHEHPGPMRKRKSQLGIAGKREVAGHARGWGVRCVPIVMALGKLFESFVRFVVDCS